MKKIYSRSMMFAIPLALEGLLLSISPSVAAASEAILEPGLYAEHDKSACIKVQAGWADYDVLVTYLAACTDFGSSIEYACKVSTGKCLWLSEDAEESFALINSKTLKLGGLEYVKVADPTPVPAPTNPPPTPAPSHNQKPEWATENRAFQLTGGKDFSIDLSKYAVDPEGASLTFANLSTRSWLRLNGSILEGRAPAVDKLSSDTLKIKVSDGENDLLVDLFLLLVP